MNRQHTTRGDIILSNTTIEQQVFEDTLKYFRCATINSDIKDIRALEPGHEILAFVKSIFGEGIFVSINQDMRGYIQGSKSLRTVKKYNNFGDLIFVTFKKI